MKTTHRFPSLKQLEEQLVAQLVLAPHQGQDDAVPGKPDVGVLLDHNLRLGS